MGNCLRRFNITRGSGTPHQQGVNPPNWHESTVRQWYLENDPILHPVPGVSIPVSQLTEDQQIEIALRLGLISSLPLFIFDENKNEKLTECIICMCDYEPGDELRYLPCLHTYHRVCIDDWLMRSATCPSCLKELHPQCDISSSFRNRGSSTSSSSLKSDFVSSLRRSNCHSRSNSRYQSLDKTSSRRREYDSKKGQKQFSTMRPDVAVSSNSTCSSVLSSSSANSSSTTPLPFTGSSTLVITSTASANQVSSPTVTRITLQESPNISSDSHAYPDQNSPDSTSGQ